MRVRGSATMKEIMDSIPVQPSGDEENFANRKLIRPALPRPDHNHGNHNSNHPAGDGTPGPAGAARSTGAGL